MWQMRLSLIVSLVLSIALFADIIDCSNPRCSMLPRYDGRCGPNYHNAACYPEQCCGPSEQCGQGDQFCNVDAICAAASETQPAAMSSWCANANVRDDGQCGPKFDGASCLPGQCCSAHSWCGSTAAHCNAHSICIIQ